MVEKTSVEQGKVEQSGSVSGGCDLGITTEKTVWCSLCAEWAQDGAAGFRETIKGWGWTLKKRKWVCPSCSKPNV